MVPRFVLSGMVVASAIAATVFSGDLREAVRGDAPRTLNAQGKRSGATVLAAAKALWATLDATQKAAALFRLGGPEHVDWHFIPRERRGISLKTISEAQRKLLDALLRAGLGEIGFKKANEVRSLEPVLAKIEGPDRPFPRQDDLYFLSFFGEPSDSTRWAWRFEGHHLSVNFELQGDRVISYTPSFYGANPGLVLKGPKKGLEVLKNVNAIARRLVTSLPEDQLARCLGEEVPREVPSTQRDRYDGPFPKGVAGAEMNAGQKKILRELLAAYVENVAPDLQARVWKELEKSGGIDQVRIAWRGKTKAFQPHSYLVHSPSFVINYSNVQDDANHVHASLRLRDGDFGKALEKK